MKKLIALSMLLTGFMALSYEPKDDAFKAATYEKEGFHLDKNDYNTLINLVREESNRDITGAAYKYLPTEEEMTVEALDNFCQRMTEKAIASGIIADHCEARTQLRIARAKLAQNPWGPTR